MPLKVLLADDSMTAQNMGKKILTDAGYQVIAVSNGAQAIKKINAEKPDVAVLDVFMPGYSGLEVCEMMRASAETARTPVILCVGKMEPFNNQDRIRVKADGVIVKPFEASDLVSMVKTLAHKVAPVPVAVPVAVPDEGPAMSDGGEAAPFGQYKGVLWRPSSEEPPVETEWRHQRNVDVPQDMAAAPAMGLEGFTEAASEEFASPPEFEIESERESQPEPEPTSGRMRAAEGLSGVFELTPAAPVAAPEPQAEVGHFDASQPEALPGPRMATVAPEVEAPAAEPEPMARGMAGFEAPPVTEPPAPAAWELMPAQSFSGSELPRVWEPIAAQAEPTDVGVATAVAESEFGEAFANLPRVAPEPVWVAEEVPLEPGEAEISLEAEMLHASLASPDETVSAEVTPAETYAPASFQAEAPTCELQPAPPMAFDAATSAETDFAPAWAVETVAQPEPAAASEMAIYTVAEPGPGADTPVDPELIAAVVDRVIERLKPELMAEVSRELHAELQKH